IKLIYQTNMKNKFLSLLLIAVVVSAVSTVHPKTSAASDMVFSNPTVKTSSSVLSMALTPALATCADPGSSASGLKGYSYSRVFELQGKVTAKVTAPAKSDLVISGAKIKLLDQNGNPAEIKDNTSEKTFGWGRCATPYTEISGSSPLTVKAGKSVNVTFVYNILSSLLYSGKYSIAIDEVDYKTSDNGTTAIPSQFVVDKKSSLFTFTGRSKIDSISSVNTKTKQLNTPPAGDTTPYDYYVIKGSGFFNPELPKAVISKTNILVQINGSWNTVSSALNLHSSDGKTIYVPKSLLPLKSGDSVKVVIQGQGQASYESNTFIYR
ncbi:MAG: hypothetical protein WCO09_03595, partial [bacterium]